VTRRDHDSAGARHGIVACLAALLVAAAGTLCLLCPASALAADVSSSAVTEIATDASSYDSYSQVKCTLSFSAESFNSGDTITVSWSTTAGDGSEIYAVGILDTIDIENTSGTDTVVIGTAEVTKYGLTITFNDNVENYTNVDGEVTFNLQVFDMGSESGTVTISSGGKSASISVTPNTASTTTPVYKTGNWDREESETGDGYEDRVYWEFRINRSYSYSFTGDDDGNIVITDTIPSGLTFDGITEISLYTSSDGADELVMMAEDEDEINSLLATYDGFSAAYDEDTGTLTVTVPASLVNDNNYYIYIQFATTVSDASQLGTKVTNTAVARYGVDGNAATDHGISETVANPISSGSSEGTGVGSISITKEVTGTAGNTDKHYTIQLSQTGLDDGSYAVTYSETEEDATTHPTEITFTNGVATLELKDGETATISGVLTGTIAVSETDLGGNTAYLSVSAQGGDDSSATTLEIGNDGSTDVYMASISTGETTSVTITNNSDLAPSTGVSYGDSWKISLLVLLVTGSAALLLIGHSIKGHDYARRE
jgi:hypothetical protein